MIFNLLSRTSRKDLFAVSAVDVLTDSDDVVDAW